MCFLFSGWKILPPMLRFKSPDREIHVSRISSAYSLRIGNLENNLFLGSIVSSGFWDDDCQVAEDKILRWSDLMDHPSSIKRLANQSRSLWWEGLDPRTPKLSVVSTKPLPKCHLQTRFTITLAVSGFWGDAIHLANCKRPLSCSEGNLSWDTWNNERNFRSCSSPKVSGSPLRCTFNLVTFPSITPWQY